MALEQLRAFRSGRSVWDFGPTERLAPDQFPLLANSELRKEHEELSKVLEEVGQVYSHEGLQKSRTFAEICQTDDAVRTRFVLALIERSFAYDAELSLSTGHLHSGFFGYGPAATAMATLWDRGVEKDAVAHAILEWFTLYRFNHYGTPALEKAVDWILKKHSSEDIPAELKLLLAEVRDQLSDVDYDSSQTFISMAQRTSFLSCPEGKWLDFQIDQFLGKRPWSMLAPSEFWAERAINDLNNAASQDAWTKLLQECAKAKSPRPSAKWLKTVKGLLEDIGVSEFKRHLVTWLELIDKARVRPTLGSVWANIDEQKRMHEGNAIVLRGLLWVCSMIPDPELTRTVSRSAMSAYRKMRGIGPRAVKVGNAAVYALSKMGSLEAVGQLGILQAKVKFGTAQKEIEKAFRAAAADLKVPEDEIQEMAIPTYGLTDVGIAEEKLGEFTARLRVTGTTSTELEWVKGDGKLQKGVPAVVKEKFAEELKELKAAAKDIERMLPAQRERIDTMFLQEKTWPVGVWRERYLDHPLVGVLARRLLWEFGALDSSDQKARQEPRTTETRQDGSTDKRQALRAGAGTTEARQDGSTDRRQALRARPRTTGDSQIGKSALHTGIWHEGNVVDLDLREISLDGDVTVRLWHPIGKEVEEVLAWREWLDTQQIQQPFKQAHREVYVLTEAERRTRVYSNRFAAHVLKQHQFNALCALRGWKNKLRLLVDAEYPPATLHLPKWGLRAEFWIEGIGEDYGTDTNESGVFLRVATDQVRFYREDAVQRTAHAGGGGYHPGYRGEDAEPVPLEEIPALVFSEVMRDVDMFVGVASVGNDPTWSDGGPNGQYRTYWGEVSFGALGGSAKTRKEVLERLVPRLKIGKVCSFEERFLVVKGKLRSYKIHLGSGNILMTPNDQYLCIVPKQGVAEDGKVLLPFEGDRTLSVILSKAFLLAEDDRIKDETITKQIKVRA
jgi:hypothetical protein